MGWFKSKKEKEKFKATLTYGEDVVSLYEESKHLERQAKEMFSRIRASEEWARKEEFEKQFRAIQQQYEILLGKKHGFDSTKSGTHLHVRDYIESMNSCDQSPFKFHAVVWEGDDRRSICIFCKKDL